MAKQLKKPPIREAIIEVKTGDELIELPDLEKFAKQIEKKLKFQDRKKIFASEFSVKFDDNNHSAFTKTNHEGYRLSYNKEQYVIQLRPNQLNISILKNYKDFERFYKKFQEIWDLYSNKFKPKNIQYVALRYINIFQLKIKDIDKYILIKPTLNIREDKPIDIVIQRAISQFIVEDIKHDVSGAINVLINPKEDENLEITLDIDCKKETNVEIETLRNDFEALRVFKNSTFFGSITKEAEKKLFN